MALVAPLLEFLMKLGKQSNREKLPTFPKYMAYMVFFIFPNSMSYSTFNILADNDIREGLKIYSNWRTYPQLYVKGQLIGGLDIVKEMKDSGDLMDTLKA